jgi:hypothetical protein
VRVPVASLGDTEAENTTLVPYVEGFGVMERIVVEEAAVLTTSITADEVLVR